MTQKVTNKTGVKVLIAAALAGPIEIQWDWYERADGARIGETDVRCLCAGYEGSADHTGFFVRDIGETFEVLSAPRGYPDTVGRRFRWKRPRPQS